MDRAGEGQAAGGDPIERFHLPDHHAGAALAQGGFHGGQGGVAVVRADQHQPGRVQAEAGDAVRIQVGARGDPEYRLLAADPPGQGGGEPGRQGTGFGVHADAADFMQLAERQPAAGQMRVDPRIAEGQHAEAGRADMVAQGGQMRGERRGAFRHAGTDRMGRPGGEGGNIRVWPGGETDKGEGRGHGICSLFVPSVLQSQSENFIGIASAGLRPNAKSAATIMAAGRPAAELSPNHGPHGAALPRGQPTCAMAAAAGTAWTGRRGPARSGAGSPRPADAPAGRSRPARRCPWRLRPG